MKSCQHPPEGSREDVEDIGLQRTAIALQGSHVAYGTLAWNPL